MLLCVPVHESSLLCKSCAIVDITFMDFNAFDEYLWGLELEPTDRQTKVKNTFQRLNNMVGKRLFYDFKK